MYMYIYIYIYIHVKHTQTIILHCYKVAGLTYNFVKTSSNVQAFFSFRYFRVNANDTSLRKRPEAVNQICFEKYVYGKIQQILRKKWAIAFLQNCRYKSAIFARKENLSQRHLQKVSEDLLIKYSSEVLWWDASDVWRNASEQVILKMFDSD